MSYDGFLAVRGGLQFRTGLGWLSLVCVQCCSLQSPHAAVSACCSQQLAASCHAKCWLLPGALWRVGCCRTLGRPFVVIAQSAVVHVSGPAALRSFSSSICCCSLHRSACVHAPSHPLAAATQQHMQLKLFDGLCVCTVYKQLSCCCCCMFGGMYIPCNPRKQQDLCDWWYWHVQWVLPSM
jgi:hypothetical protein